MLVGCGELQQATPAAEAKTIERVAGSKAPEITELLRKHGGKKGKEFKAKGE